MKLVFCGTPQFAIPSLRFLLSQSDFQILAVITQPDRPRGRSQEVSASLVKETATAAGIPVHQPEKISSPGAQELLQQLAPDCIVIIAYGQIVPARLLPIPQHGWINLHASVLPKYRGAAPIHWAIANGETRTGLTTMRIDAGMDTGDILLSEELTIGPTETAPQLAERLSQAGAPLVAQTLRGLAAGTLTPRPQNHREATTAPILKKEDGRIDWNRASPEIYNRIRGFTPWPGAYSTFRGQNCQLWGEPVSKDPAAPSAGNASTPGTLLRQGHELRVVCGGATVLRLTAVKLEGRKIVSAAEFSIGARLTEQERFGNA